MPSLFGYDIPDQQFGGGLSAAGDILGGIGDFMSGQATASADKLEQQWVEQATAIQSLLQKRKAYQLQSSVTADAGASGLASSGSVESILAMNAQNIALDNAMIRQQGAEHAGVLGMQARAAEAQGTAGLIGGILKGVGTIATAGIF